MLDRLQPNSKCQTVVGSSGPRQIEGSQIKTENDLKRRLKQKMDLELPL
jgi:hypothetical protein